MANTEINKYLSNLSRHHITEAIESTSNNSLALFTNIMYFEALWENPFEFVMTQKFVNDQGEVFVVEMMGVPRMEYFVTLTPKMEMIEVPLAQEFSNFGFFIVRPRLEGKRDTIEVEEELQTAEFQRFLVDRVIQERPLMLPVFTMYYMEDMTDELKFMGVRDVFDINLANMSALFNNSENTTFEDAFTRQGWIDVNQKGFAMSAFSGAGVEKSGAVSGKVMHADRPFLFLVFEKSTTTLMFAGRISNPNGWKMDDASSNISYELSWYLIGLTYAFVGIVGFCCCRAVFSSGSFALPDINGYSQRCATCCSGCLSSCLDRIRSCCPYRNSREYPESLFQEHYTLVESEDGLNVL